MFKYTVIDNVIPKNYQELIKQRLYSRNFEWYFIEDVTAKTKDLYQGRPANSHVFINDGTVNSKHLDLVLPIAFNAADIVGFDFQAISFARSFMQYPLNSEVIGKNNELLDSFHVDDITKNHMVVLYYVNDSDGPTVILDKYYDKESGSFPDTDIKESEELVLARVEPKQGRCVVFDGRLYHTATQPRNSMRSVINFNLELHND